VQDPLTSLSLRSSLLDWSMSVLAPMRTATVLTQHPVGKVATDRVTSTRKRCCRRSLATRSRSLLRGRSQDLALASAGGRRLSDARLKKLEEGGVDHMCCSSTPGSNETCMFLLVDAGRERSMGVSRADTHRKVSPEGRATARRVAQRTISHVILGVTVPPLVQRTLTVRGKRHA